MIPTEQYEQSAAFLREALPFIPEAAVVLGSGLGGLAEETSEALRIPYEEIPGFPRSTVASHAGLLTVGMLAGRKTAVFSGRTHYYEGYSTETVAYYVRVLKLLGVKTLILTNAAGGVNEKYRIGDLMLIADHIKFGLESPARGECRPLFGPRFFDMTRAYSPRLRETARRCADKLGISLREGVYFYMPGPEFETPAEIRAIRTLGGDAVGMSTVAEAVAASQCGLAVLGLSCITNLAAGMTPDTTVSDEEVTANAALAADRFGALIKAILAAL